MRHFTFNAVLLSVVLTTSASAFPIDFGISRVGNAGIDFNGPADTFEFRNSTDTFGGDLGYQFAVNSIGGIGWPVPGNAVGDLFGLRGRFIGTSTIGAISGPPSSEVASVTGTGTLELWDASLDNNTLNDVKVMTATVSWLSIGAGGVTGDLNKVGVFNVSNFTCYLSNCAGRPNLTYLSAAKTGSASISFDSRINGVGQNLTKLTSAAGTTSLQGFSGIITATPEPSFYGLLVVGMSSLGWFAMRRRKSEEV